VEKISGYERINSDKNRLDGQREHPVSPSSILEEHDSRPTTLINLEETLSSTCVEERKDISL